MYNIPNAQYRYMYIQHKASLHVHTTQCLITVEIKVRHNTCRLLASSLKCCKDILNIIYDTKGSTIKY